MTAPDRQAEREEIERLKKLRDARRAALTSTTWDEICSAALDLAERALKERDEAKELNETMARRILALQGGTP